jgi:hypothetical protein
MRLVSAVLAIAVTATPGLATDSSDGNDGAVLHLRNGSVQAGVLRPRGTTNESTWLELDAGMTVGFTRSEVTSIVLTETSLSRLYARESEIERMGDVADRLSARKALSIQADGEGLPQFARRQAERLIAEADGTSEDAALLSWAHETLGHVPRDGTWMTEAEARVAQGYVQFGGRWVREAERERVLAARAADRRHRKELRLQRQRLAAEQRTLAEPEQPSVLTEVTPYGGDGYGPFYLYDEYPTVRRDRRRTARPRHRPNRVRQLWDTPWWADPIHGGRGVQSFHPNRGRPFHPSPRALKPSLPGHAGGGRATASGRMTARR